MKAMQKWLAWGMFFFLMGASLPSHGQVLIALLFGDKLNSDKLEFGLNVGGNFSTLSNVEGVKWGTGLSLGLFFTIKLSDKWYLHPEAIPKSPLGVRDISPYPTGDANLDSLMENGSVTRRLNYIHVPLLVRYKAARRFFIDAGPYIGLRTGAKDEFATEVNEDELIYNRDVADEVGRWDLGLAGGLTYKLRDRAGLSFIARYYYGFVNIAKNNPNAGIRNSFFQLILGIPIGAGKPHDEGEPAPANEP